MNGVQILMMNQQKKSIYGYLYNWYAVSTANFAPSGWHVPTNTEYYTLSTYLGGTTVSGGKLKETGTTYWISPNTGATNISKFFGRGGGFRDDTFTNIRGSGVYWTSTEYSTSSGRATGLNYNVESQSFYYTNKRVGMSIRLVKDSTTLSNGETSTMTDYDGNTYDTICIGTQEWTVQNWKCTKLNDGTALTKVTSDTTWASATTGDLYYCAYNNNENYV